MRSLNAIGISSGGLLRKWIGRIHVFATVCALQLVGGTFSGAAEPVWRPVDWNDERALRSTAEGWQAIVSLDRGRLVHFGPADTNENLLFAPATRDHPNGWGGHRVWLGPQADWTHGWPPPPAWEHSAAEVVKGYGPVLELAPASAGEGWPSFQRSYRWERGRLVCGVHLRDDGSRDAQVVQILQMPTTVRVEARLQPSMDWPAGYVGLAAGDRRRLATLAEPPAHARVDGNRLQLRHLGVVEKLGFRPHALRGRIGLHTIIVSRGESAGQAVAEPDAGFLTQVYLGGLEPFAELEQLSPLWRAGTKAVFEMVIQGVTERPDQLHPTAQPRPE